MIKNHIIQAVKAGLFSGFVLLLLGGCQHINSSGYHHSHAHKHYHDKGSFHNQEGLAVLAPVNQSSVKGIVRFTKSKRKAGKKQVLVTAEITGLEPNKKYGFHVHQFGRCEENALHAGGHFNPHSKKHGLPGAKERHIGDMGNLTASANGTAVYKSKVNMCLWGAMGRAVIVHAQADDGKTQPSGQAGSYIACGIIGRTAAAKKSSSTLEDDEDDLLLEEASKPSSKSPKLTVLTNSKKPAGPAGKSVAAAKKAVAKPVVKTAAKPVVKTAGQKVKQPSSQPVKTAVKTSVKKPVQSPAKTSKPSKPAAPAAKGKASSPAELKKPAAKPAAKPVAKQRPKKADSKKPSAN